MKKYTHFIVSISAFFLLLSCATPNVEPSQVLEGRYEREVFSEIDLQRDLMYGSNVTQAGVQKNLLLDIYEPKGDVETKRPVIVIAHGGYFVRGVKDDIRLIAALSGVIKAGYVIVSISYRFLDVEANLDNGIQELLDATFDMKAAVRFMAKNAEKYRIDPDNIYVAGYSAGAVMALQCGYLSSKEELKTSLSTITDQAGVDRCMKYVDEVGGLEGNSGNQGVSYKIKGVINISGGMSSAAFVSSGEPILVSVHGDADTVIPYADGQVKVVDKNLKSGGSFPFEGSKLIHQRADKLGIANLLKTVTGKNHDAFLNCSDCTSDIMKFLYKNL